MQIIIKSGNTDHTQRTLAAKILAIALPVSLLLPITFQNIVIFLGLAVLLLSQASLFKHRIVFPFYLFLGVAVFTSLVSPTHFTGIVNLKSFIWDVLLLFVLGIFLGSREKERVYLSFLYATLIIVGVTLLLYLFIPSALSPVLNRKGLLTGFLGGRLTYAGVISFLLPLFSVKEVGDNKKLIWIAAFILILSIAYNLSRSYYLAVSVFFLFRREEIKNKKLPSFHSIHPCNFSEPPYQKKGRNCGRVFKGQKCKFAAGTLENWAKNIPKISLHWVGI